ncbi:DEDDh family exonuclease [Streptomyces sp. NPDC004838]
MNVVSALDGRSSSSPAHDEWAVVDVETTGLRPHQHRVLSVAVLTLNAAGEPTGEYSTLLDPGVDPGPVHIHGLTPQRLRGAPTFEQVADRVGELLRDRVMVAHNAQFDYDFLAHEFARARSWLPVSQRLCTLTLNRRVSPPTGDLKLASLAAHYGVPQQRAHDALDDARVLAGVLRRSLDAAEELGIDLPLVACPPKQGSGFPPRIPKTPCAFRNPGRLAPGAPLVQGMKIAFTGEMRLSREELVARSVAEGLNVMSTVSRHTSVLIADDRDSGTAKASDARAVGTPCITEDVFLALLAAVRPGVRHEDRTPSVPAPGRADARPHSDAEGPLSRRRVLVLGGPHDHASSLRSRVVELGGAAAVNLSAGVTDVVLLPGGEEDRRLPRITARRLPVHDASWLDGPARSPQRPVPGAVPPDPASGRVLPRGGVADLPEDDSAWTVGASWSHHTAGEVDVVAFTVDDEEQVLCDEDFVFYGAPQSPDGTVRLATDGPTEQAVTVDLAALPDAARKVVIAAAIDGTATFADVGAVEITVSPGTGEKVLAQATLDAATTERTLLLAEIYRRGAQWRVRAVGQGYDHGLATLARGYGVDVTD